MADQQPLPCVICNTPLTNDTPSMQMNCLHWCHTRCGFMAMRIVDAANLDEIFDATAHSRCPTCHQTAIPDEWYEEANDRIRQLEDEAQAHDYNQMLHGDAPPAGNPANPEQTIPTQIENLELSSPQFNEDVKKYVDACRVHNKASIAFGKLVKKNSREFKELTKGAIEILKNHQKQYKKLLMASEEYKTLRSVQGKSQRLYTVLDARYDLPIRTLNRYLRKKFRVTQRFGRLHWYSSPQYKIRRAFRIRL